jgi:hypothetical protein
MSHGRRTSARRFPIRSSARSARHCSTRSARTGWIRWSKGDARWDTLAALVSVLDRRDVDASAASWSASLSIVVEAVRDASQSRSPLTMQDAMMAIEELVAVCREPP